MLYVRVISYEYASVRFQIRTSEVQMIRTKVSIISFRMIYERMILNVSVVGEWKLNIHFFRASGHAKFFPGLRVSSETELFTCTHEWVFIQAKYVVIWEKKYIANEIDWLFCGREVYFSDMCLLTSCKGNEIVYTIRIHYYISIKRYNIYILIWNNIWKTSSKLRIFIYCKYREVIGCIIVI